MTGVDSSMVTLGRGIGSALSKSKHLSLVLIICFAIGFMITFAEPDLAVLGTQVKNATSLNNPLLFIAVVSIGVGATFALGIIKMMLRISYAKLLSMIYTILFVIVIFAPQTFTLLAFDAGAVTTGALSVPFILSFGIGFCAIRSDAREDEGMGMLGIASIGPVLSTMFLGLFIENTGVGSVETQAEMEFWKSLVLNLSSNMRETALVLAPIIIVFLIFQFASLKYSKTKVAQMFIGFLFTFIGISVFLTGVNCGLLPIAKVIGDRLFAINSPSLSIFIVMLLGAFAVVAEPSLQILKKQIETITSGAVKGWAIFMFIVIGVALAGGVAAAAAIFNFNTIPVLIILYAFSIIMTFINTNLFSAIAFDSGAIATGTMAVTFILPLVSQISTTGGGFGTIGLIAVFPIFTLQLFGLIYKIQLIKSNKAKEFATIKQGVSIIEFDYKRRK